MLLILPWRWRCALRWSFSHLENLKIFHLPRSVLSNIHCGVVSRNLITVVTATFPGSHHVVDSITEHPT